MGFKVLVSIATSNGRSYPVIELLIVSQVENITRDNLDKVIDRGDHLDDLQRRAGERNIAITETER